MCVSHVCAVLCQSIQVSYCVKYVFYSITAIWQCYKDAKDPFSSDPPKAPPAVAPKQQCHSGLTGVGDPKPSRKTEQFWQLSYTGDIQQYAYLIIMQRIRRMIPQGLASTKRSADSSLRVNPLGLPTASFAAYFLQRSPYATSPSESSVTYYYIYTITIQ